MNSQSVDPQRLLWFDSKHHILVNRSSVLGIYFFSCIFLTKLFFQLADDDTEVSFSDRELELDEPGDLSSLPWSERLGDGFISPLPSSSRSASLAAQLRTERSGRDTPASVDSIPLEWDHDYDLSRSLESASRALRDQQSEEGDFLQRSASALSGQFTFTLYSAEIRFLSNIFDLERWCIHQKALTKAFWNIEGTEFHSEKGERP